MGARRGFTALVAAVSVLALVAAACGDDGGGGGGGDISLLPENEATGKPFPIGVINAEGTPSFDFPEYRESIQAAAEYVNNNLGGIDGRPIEIDACNTRGTPEGGDACAQELADAKVELVLAALPVFVPFDTFKAAGIPVIGNVPILPTDFTTDNALYFGGGNPGVMASIALFLDEVVGAEQVGIVSTTNPAGAVALPLLTDALDELDIDYTVATGGDAEADYTPLFRSAADPPPDAFVSLYSGQGCSGTMTALDQLRQADPSFDVPAVTTTLCRDEDVIEAVGDAAVNWHFSGGGVEIDNPDTEDPDAIAYRAAMEAYAPGGLVTGGFSPAGFQLLMTVYEAAVAIAEQQGSADDLTGKEIFDYLKEEPETDVFLSGEKIDCGVLADRPSVCVVAISFTEYTPGGVYELSAERIDPIELLR